MVQMHLPFFGLLLGVALLCCQCQTSSQSTATSNDVVLEHQRGACFGPCPIYVLQWRSDGSATLDIQKGFPDPGAESLSPGHYFRLANRSNASSLRDILRQAENIRFDTLGGRYDNPMIMDLPTIRTVINGVEVIDRFDGPDLATLYDDIKAWILNGDWASANNSNN